MLCLGQEKNQNQLASTGIRDNDHGQPQISSVTWEDISNPAYRLVIANTGNY